MANKKERINDLGNLTGGLAILGILFEMILQQMPPQEAEELTDGYRAGRNISLVFGPSLDGWKIAFACELTDDQDWRGARSSQIGGPSSGGRPRAELLDFPTEGARKQDDKDDHDQ